MSTEQSSTASTADRRLPGALDTAAWRAAGVPDPLDADAWRAHGFTPNTARAWVKLELLPAEATAIVNAGLTPTFVQRIRAADRRYTTTATPQDTSPPFPTADVGT